ncbi:Hca operon transcriptional activator [Slackia heliotrinireducens]|uniref:Transcriptional regulator n=1 Tax=Slackia heliotrinireducens (strain ATCC 29202 / DSM 20476 / NCTC 11029 / RHS 1) TaxID=471855 RepID=C7N3H6_SLAHD|nr:LysR family transcriptional regulator [Slackia heliotrinireducens]ACV23699.1 transcriptional regulator [Slackia heliotrinireducens DSM 20476]VEH03265.1 Hca operon transcriptional activator [Slackia heliotrinireducens]
MDLSVLRDFVVLAESQNFTKAAEAVHTSQPNLSKRMAVLERELGFKLFVRDTRSVSLTKSGRALYPSVIDVLARFDAGVERARGEQESDVAVVTLGGNYANSKILSLAESAAAYAKNQEMPFQIEVNRAFLLVDSLVSGYVEPTDSIEDGLDDVIITFSCSNLAMDGRKSVRLYQDSFALFVSVEAGFEAGSQVSLRDLEGLAFIRPTVYETYNQRVQDVCDELGIHPVFRRSYYDSMGDMAQGVEPDELMIIPASAAHHIPGPDISHMVRVLPTDHNAYFEVVAVYDDDGSEQAARRATCCSVLKRIAQEMESGS